MVDTRKAVSNKCELNVHAIYDGKDDTACRIICPQIIWCAAGHSLTTDSPPNHLACHWSLPGQ